jgi:hypothetical protein
MQEMVEKMESPDGLEVYRVRAKTVERVFGHIKQNIGLRGFLTRGLGGVRAEFSLACIAHNLKRIWKTKSQIEGIGVNSTDGGRFDYTFLKSLCGRINAFMSMSGSLGYKAIRGILNSIMGQPLNWGVCLCLVAQSARGLKSLLCCLPVKLSFTKKV